jgi:hypothetical protein
MPAISWLCLNASSIKREVFGWNGNLLPIASIFDAAYQLARLLWPTNTMAAPVSIMVWNWRNRDLLLGTRNVRFREVVKSSPVTDLGALQPAPQLRERLLLRIGT